MSYDGHLLVKLLTLTLERNTDYMLASDFANPAAAAIDL
jgi:hypothetical protein